jgi:hypothetical protein
VGDAPVLITEYNPAWPQKFAEQRDRLEMSLRPWLSGPDPARGIDLGAGPTSQTRNRHRLTGQINL